MEAQRVALAARAASELPFSPNSLFSKLSLWKLGGRKHRSPRGCTANGGRGYAYHLLLRHRRRRFGIGPLVGVTRTTSGCQTSTRHFLARLLEGEATGLTVRFGSMDRVERASSPATCPYAAESRSNKPRGANRVDDRRVLNGIVGALDA
jgi:hypothetical protein